VDRLTAARGQDSILAVHPGALGDVILFGHLLAALKARVTLLAGGEKARLLQGLGVADAAMDINSLPIQEVFADTPLEQCRLPKLLGRHDRLISCLGGGDRRAEQRLAAMCHARDAAFLPVRPQRAFQRHLLDLWTDLLGLPPIEPASRCWNVPKAWVERGRALLAEAGVHDARGYALIHPGAGSASKCWPVERFLELAGRFPGSQGLGGEGLAAVFVIGPVEQERWDQGQVAKLRRDFPVLVCPELTELAGVMKEAASFVGNDSGVAHLAASVGTPTVALFGPSQPRHFAPCGQAVQVITAKRITDIAAEGVLAALEALPCRGDGASRSGGAG
jgi:ADP-heptose:LPS heptosyltransferase